MKVIIIGAGIGGLTSYLGLQKMLGDLNLDPAPTIKVYEAHANPTLAASRIGGGLGLGPNGLRTLATLCPAAVQQIQTKGFESHFMTIRNSKGWLLGRRWVGKGGRYTYPQMMLARQTVHEAILAEVPAGVVQWGKRLKAITEKETGVEVEFEDGLVEHADLVIGADGVKSLVREAVVGTEYPASYE
jgi:2-polyprenyl-6-methoxyphenol hydroxylase-like FAD-dependent oxidoreductase